MCSLYSKTYRLQNQSFSAGYIDGTTMGHNDNVILYTINNPPSDNQKWNVVKA